MESLLFAFGYKEPRRQWTVDDFLKETGVEAKRDTARRAAIRMVKAGDLVRRGYTNQPGLFKAARQAGHLGKAMRDRVGPGWGW